MASRSISAAGPEHTINLKESSCLNPHGGKYSQGGNHSPLGHLEGPESTRGAARGRGGGALYLLGGGLVRGSALGSRPGYDFRVLRIAIGLQEDGVGPLLDGPSGEVSLCYLMGGNAWGRGKREGDGGEGGGGQVERKKAGTPHRGKGGGGGGTLGIETSPGRGWRPSPPWPGPAAPVSGGPRTWGGGEGRGRGWGMGFGPT